MNTRNTIYMMGQLCSLCACSGPAPHPCAQLTSPDADVQFYMESCDYDGHKKRVAMEVVPQYRKELMEELFRQIKYEKDTSREFYANGGSTRIFDDGYGYHLFVTTKDGSCEEMLFVKNKTYLGGYTTREFDAKKYFTEASWKEVNEKLRTADDDERDRTMYDKL